MSDRAAELGAYGDRNRVVAVLASIFRGGVRRTDTPGWEPEWRGCVYVDTPCGQVSWHYHDREAHLFAGLPAYTRPWDGHDTAEKYRRLEELVAFLRKSPVAHPAGLYEVA